MHILDLPTDIFNVYPATIKFKTYQARWQIGDIYVSGDASKNMNPKDLQYIMGHSNISITMNWYAHASIDTAKSEVQRLIA